MENIAVPSPSAAVIELATRFFELKAASKSALKANQRTSSAVASLRANLLASRVQREVGAVSPDAAIIMMRGMRDSGMLG